MQKENPVIKNYILVSKKRILKENPPYINKSISQYSDNLLYHELSRQNKVYPFLFLL